MVSIYLERECSTVHDRRPPRRPTHPADYIANQPDPFASLTMSMRLAGGDADALDRACIDLRAKVGRRVDRSEVMRELVALFLQDDDTKERVTTGLEVRKISRGGDVGPGL